MAPSEQLERKIVSSELDVALIEGIPHSQELISEEYLEDHLSVICPANGRFQQGQQMRVAEFRKQKFLLREPGSGTRDVFDRVVREAGFSVNPAWEATSTTALVNAVINGLGIAVLPHRMVTGPLERGQVVTVGVDGLDFHRRFHIVYHKDKFLTSSAKAFLDLCRNYEADYPHPTYQGL